MGKYIAITISVLAFIFADIVYTRETAFCVDSISNDSVYTDLGLLYNKSSTILQTNHCYYAELQGVITHQVNTIYMAIDLGTL